MDEKDIIIMAYEKNPYGLNDERRTAFAEGFLTAANLLQGLTWHKVSDEMPPVDTEVVCKMKGVPYTEHLVCKWNGKYWVHWGCFGQGREGWFGLNIGWEVVEWKEI